MKAAPSYFRATTLLGIIFALDRLTKWWTIQFLAQRGTVRVLPFFYFTYVENTGAAFGVFRDSNIALIIFAVLLLVVMGYLFWTAAGDNSAAFYGIVLVAGGALGNLFDRIAYGHVIDFLDFKVWPVFNIADSCICIGAAMLAWSMSSWPMWPKMN